MSVPLRCVVDTNVAMTANGANDDASTGCVAQSARALRDVMASGHVFVDDRGRIVEEYRANLGARGQRGPGDVFFMWVMDRLYDDRHVTRVTITPRDDDEDSFIELPAPDDGVAYDRSDRKFLAVAAAHPEHPPVLQSLDSKWWGWQESLKAIGVAIHFLCAAEIARKHDGKMGTSRSGRAPRKGRARHP